MNLYQALQGILDKVNDSATEAKYHKEEREMLRTVLENQVRLGEAVVILGGLLQGILAKEVEVEVRTPKGASRH